jgi:hypothetical protein
MLNQVLVGHQDLVKLAQGSLARAIIAQNKKRLSENSTPKEHI